VQYALGSWCRGSLQCKISQFDGVALGGSSSRCPGRALPSTVLVGHRGFGYCRDVEISKRGLFTFAVLREPISRIRSLFDYRLLSHAMAGGGDLSSAVLRYNSTERIETGEMRLRSLGLQQARFLCGYHCMGPEAVKMYRELNHTAAEVERIVLNKAKHNLMRMDAVGVLEHFDDLITQMRYQTHIVPWSIKHWPEANTVKRKKTVLTPDAIAILKEWNAPDIELYNLAMKLNKARTVEAAQCLAVLEKAGALKKAPTPEQLDKEVDKEDAAMPVADGEPSAVDTDATASPVDLSAM